MNALSVLKIFTWRIVTLDVAGDTGETYFSFTGTTKKHFSTFMKV
jgi:hypothetical protein